MSLSAVFRSVPATVRRHESTFQRARTSQPAFARYATATALLESLSIQSGLPLEERQEVVRAIVGLHQTTRHPLWQALLLHAFRRMLLSLHAGEEDPQEDCDQRVVLAFLQALDRARLAGQPVFLAIQRATARVLFQAVRAGRDDVKTEPLDAAIATPSTQAHADPPPFVTCLAHEMAERLLEHEGGADLARLLIGQENSGEQARRLAQEETPSGGPSPSAAALRRRKVRALRDLRAEFRGKPSRRTHD
jgi:hypothetical protein